MTEHIEEILRNSPKWHFKEINDDLVESFSNESGLDKLTCKLLIARGVDSISKLNDYINDDIDLLYNPFLFNQMERTVNRVKKAIDNAEKIFIFGDRDVDGVLSTAMLFNMLRLFGSDVSFAVPEGECGYGIEKKHIEQAKEKGVTLIITVDTGISSIEEVDLAKRLGIDTIIMDHHLKPDGIPDAHSIINPKLTNEHYPYKNLSGGGVVLKFIHAFIISMTKNYNKNFYVMHHQERVLNFARVKNGIIEEISTMEESLNYNIFPNSTIVKDYRYALPKYFENWLKQKKIKMLNLVCHRNYRNIEEFANIFSKLFIRKQKKSLAFMESFIDLAAISTISDIMPLTGENRVIVKRGLKRLRKTKNLGLKVLMKYCDLDDEITAKKVAWNLAPIINAAGRMGDAKIAVDLFTTEDVEKANEFARMLLEMNEKRKMKGDKNFSIINPLVEEGYYKDPVIVLSTDKAEHGVTGIIASKISRKYSKPAIIIVSDGKMGIGSGRGGKGTDLVSLISQCSDLLVKYGGHRSAVGFTIDIENIGEFRERINEIAKLYKDILIGKEKIEIDAVIFPEDITYDLYKSLKIFEPVGVGNEPPQFSIIGTTVINPILIGRDKNHIKFFIPSKRGVIPVVGWGIGEKAKAIIENSELVDIVFYMEENNFRNDRSLQLVLQDIRPTENL